MGILKLADEMGLSCIKAYKLDALKSVREANETRNLGVADNCSELIVTMEENTATCHTTTGARVTNAAEDSSTTTVLQTGKQQSASMSSSLSSPHQLYNCVHYVPWDPFCSLDGIRWIFQSSASHGCLRAHSSTACFW